MSRTQYFVAVILAPILLIITVMLPTPAKAGPMDNGPHSLVLMVVTYQGVSVAAVAEYDNKEECKAAAADLHEQLTASFSHSSTRYVAVCIAAKNT